jgi:hypothetical protein
VPGSQGVPMLRRTVLCTLFAALSFTSVGCVAEGTEPGSDPRAAEGPLVGHVIEFALEPDALGHDRVKALSQRIESITAAETMKIKVEKSDDGGTVVVAEAWGRTAITADAIGKDLRSTFPELANAVITVKAATGEPPSAKLPDLDLDVDDDEDPEVVRKQVVERLRAEGVQGDVQVHVDENEDGKREIRVEVSHEDKQIAPR